MLRVSGAAGFYRAMPMHSADYAVRLSVRLSHVGIVLKQLNLLSKIYRPVATPF